MRHGKKFNHLGRTASHRKALLSNMACSLIEHKRINTTVAKAKALIDKGAEAGVDYVKFQTFKAEKLVTKQAQRAAYQDKNTQNNDSQYEMLKKLELSQTVHQELIDYCKVKGVKFLSTGFDNDSLAFLAQLGVRIAKVPSGEITNLPYLRQVASLFPEVILSTVYI